MINKIIKRLEKRAQKYSVVTNPAAYMNNKKKRTRSVPADKDKYTLIRSNIIPNVGSTSCSDLGGGNNCTLTATFNIMQFYRQQGFDKIPENDDELYKIIMEQAMRLGYNEQNGIGLFKIDNLVRDTWRKGLGYTSGSARSRYIWRHKRLTDEIDKGRPFIFSLASGVYFNHTIVIYGYEVHRNERTGKEYTFLIAADAWSSQKRYLAFTRTRAKYLSCVTYVEAPEKDKTFENEAE